MGTSPAGWRLWRPARDVLPPRRQQATADFGGGLHVAVGRGTGYGWPGTGSSSQVYSQAEAPA